MCIYTYVAGALGKIGFSSTTVISLAESAGAPARASMQLCDLVGAIWHVKPGHALELHLWQAPESTSVRGRMGDIVKITVVGDESVGKTSLITTAATESFPEHPPPLLPPTKLPPETTAENRPVLVTDTSSRPEDRQSLELSCCQADVIVLLFDTGRLPLKETCDARTSLEGGSVPLVFRALPQCSSGIIFMNIF